MNNNNYFNFKLTNDQDTVFKSLIEFTKSNTEKIFILKGYAGTGKTTLMSGYIKYLNTRNVNFQLLASTGRASKIISDITKLRATTIHSHIYSFRDLSDDLEEIYNNQQNNSDKSGQISLVFELGKVNSKENILYIIDEASMISDDITGPSSFAKFGSGNLLKDLFDFDHNGKFIFIGDPIQLPPVGQKTSPALSKDHIELKYGYKCIEYELKKIMRQAQDNGIIEASLKIRKLYNRNPNIKWPKIPLKNNSNVNLIDSETNLVISYADSILNNGNEFSTLICQTNRQCSDFNEIIRNILYNKPIDIEKNDVLLVTQNNLISGLVNGDMISVIKIGETDYRCNLTFQKLQIQELVSKKIFNVLIIKDVLDSSTNNLNDKQNKDLLIDFYVRMKKIGIKQRSDEFNKRMKEDAYLNAHKVVYGYALTCHKSQGGEWNEVYLHLSNKMFGIPRPEIYRWWYTAITRAKEQLTTINNWWITN